VRSLVIGAGFVASLFAPSLLGEDQPGASAPRTPEPVKTGAAR
jgi:hypothetical protein